MTKRHVLIDMMRIFAMVLVFIVHSSPEGSMLKNHYGIEGFYYVTLGGVGVTLFLILSGISLELKYGGRLLDYWKFMRRRLLKIYPTYYLVVVIALLFSIAGIVPVYFEPGIGHIFMIVTGTYAFFGQWGGPFVATSWFIGVIVSLYFMYPMLSRYLRVDGWLVLSILFIISVGSRCILEAYDLLSNRAIDWFPLSRIFEFGLGVFLVLKLPKDVWSSLDSFGNDWISYLARLSFPFFLLHFPLLSMLGWLAGYGVSGSLSFVIYLVVSVAMSSFVLLLAENIW